MVLGDEQLGAGADEQETCKERGRCSDVLDAFVVAGTSMEGEEDAGSD